MAKVTHIEDYRFCIELNTLQPNGRFRGVQRGDTFTHDGVRYRVHSFETFFNGDLKYVVEALPL